MVQRLRLHLLPATARASHFHLRPGSAILQLVVPLLTVKADSPSDFPRLAREKGSRPVVAAVVFSARSSPAVALSVAVDSAETVFVVAGPDSAVAADLVCFSGSVCFFAVGMAKGKAVVVISCFLTPRSSF